MVLKPRSKMINNFILTCVQIKGVGRKRVWERYLHSALYSFRFYNRGIDPFKKNEQIFIFFWICNTFDIFIKYGKQEQE
jgi:hypothetical protein